jgi:hypothetical protein
MIRELVDFAGVKYDPAKRDVFYASDYNYLAQFMKPTNESVLIAEVARADVNFVATDGTLTPVYVVPQGYRFCPAWVLCEFLETADWVSPGSGGLQRDKTGDPISGDFLTSDDGASGAAIAGYTGLVVGAKTQWLDAGETVSFMLGSSVVAAANKGRVHLFGMLLPALA